jgi:signal transduction histidine kinase/ligand-binding sensor domain-containing protein/DNA-binding response OmpR family regulator
MKHKIVFILLLALFLHARAGIYYKFYHHGVNDGLSQSSVTCFYKDSRGFMWIGTQSGLNRYDGYKFVHYKANKSIANSISNNYITDITEDKNGNLWIATLVGLNRLNLKTGKITKWYENNKDTTQLNTNYITDILVDSKGRVWVMGGWAGLHLFNPAKSCFTRYYRKDLVPSYNLSQLCEDKNGLLWLSDNRGILYSFNPATNQCAAFASNSKLPAQNGFKVIIDNKNVAWLYSTNEIYLFSIDQKKYLPVSLQSLGLNKVDIVDIKQDLQGNYWISTISRGLIILDNNLHIVNWLTHNDKNPASLLSNGINTTYADNDGMIWIGSQNNGFSIFHQAMQKFDLFQYNENQNNSISNSGVNCIFEDSHRNIWVGTYNGLNLFNQASQTFERIPVNQSITSISEDTQNNLWLGTVANGVYTYNLNAKQIRKIFNYNNLSITNISSLYRDSYNNLWIGTSGQGIFKYVADKKEFTTNFIKQDGFNSAAYIHTFYEDKQKNFWIGNSYGLIHYNRHNGQFRYFVNRVNDSTSLSEDHVLCIFEDSRNYLWMGTLNGLNIFDRKTQKFRSFTTANGLAGSSVYAITEDAQHRLWITTDNGISMLHIKPAKSIYNINIEVFNYSENDGLQGRSFIINACLKASDDLLYFGGNNGLNILNINNLKDKRSFSKLSFTGFLLFNQKVETGQTIDNHVILKEDIASANEIEVKSSENVFSIEFSALNYVHANQIKYAYFLEGFSNQWITTTSDNRIATFTNLSPGKYVFRLKASNSDGSWDNTEKSLIISILPPWYCSSAAYMAYVLILIALALFIRKSIIRNRQSKEKQRIAQQQLELSTMKADFYANISHELRTPLSLILAPTEKLMNQKLPDEINSHLSLIYRNARRLLNMVNQLLDFKRIETGQVQFFLSYGDLVMFVRDIVHSFSDLTDNKDIELKFESSVEELYTYFDSDKMEKLLFNLLSNAYKFTPEHGQITVSLHVNDANLIIIKVKDSGIGIEADKLNKIFDRYYQANNQTQQGIHGNGIGLALVKEYVKIHNGTIGVESQVGNGTCFTIQLPFKTESVENKLDGTINIENSLPLILLVDDNDDLRFFIRESLKPRYNIVEASDGESALSLAMQHLPDLIISDVMMPKMNGLELCKRIKTSAETSHIPIILLTAKSSDSAVYEGYQTGADAYITKPFSPQLLDVRIDTLIKEKKEHQHKMIQYFDVSPSEIEITSLDEQFIKRAIEVIEQHLQEPEYSVEHFGNDMNISRVHLYKKLMALTGKSPSELIRSMRLKRAAQLLQKSQLTVAEIAYQVGFSHPKYFSTCFKQEFNMLPSDYADQIKNNEPN